MRQRLIAGATGKTQCGGADSGAEHIQRCHRDLETPSRFAQQLRGRNRAVLKIQGSDRVWRYDIDAFTDRETGGIRRHDKRTQAPGARRLSGTRKYGVKVGDPGIGDPGFFAIENIVVTIPLSTACHRADIGARLFFRQCKGSDALA